MCGQRHVLNDRLVTTIERIVYTTRKKDLLSKCYLRSWHSLREPSPDPGSEIVRKSQENGFKQLTEGFCSDSNVCIMASGNEGDNRLLGAKDMYYKRLVISNDNGEHSVITDCGLSI